MDEGQSGCNGQLAKFSLSISTTSGPAEFIGFFPIVSSDGADETILLRDETIFRFWRRCLETTDSYQVANETAGTAGHR